MRQDPDIRFSKVRALAHALYKRRRRIHAYEEEDTYAIRFSKVRALAHALYKRRRRIHAYEEEDTYARY